MRICLLIVLLMLLPAVCWAEVPELRCDLVEYLKSEITEKSILPDIVDAFERMCQMPSEQKEEMILFEVGTFDFMSDGEPMLYFCMVRQYSDEEDEFYQVRVDVSYKPKEETGLLTESVWSEMPDANIFDYIRKSPAYECLKEEEIVSVDIRLDRT